VYIAIELLLLLLGGILLAVVLIQIFSRDREAARPRPGQASVKLLRSLRVAEDIEETRLLINDQVILIASSEGTRLADYADEVERLEAVATRIASALGVGVELARVGARGLEPEEGIPVRQLPKGRLQEPLERSF
jgi:hypothetical protein